MPIQIIKFSDEDKTKSAAIKFLNKTLSKLAGNPTLLLLSGGSSLDLLDGIDKNFLGPHITICPLDERYSKNSQENNMVQIKSTSFFVKAVGKQCKIIDTKVKGNESQQDLAKRFNKNLKNWLEKYPNGKIVATVGIGGDGHVSGMMPFPENQKKFESLFDSKNNYVVAYDASGKNPYPLRVTTNMNLMRRINVSIVYMIGKNKKEILERFESKTGNIPSTPSRILREIKGEVKLFTDIH